MVNITEDTTKFGGGFRGGNIRLKARYLAKSGILGLKQGICPLQGMGVSMFSSFFGDKIRQKFGGKSEKKLKKDEKTKQKRNYEKKKRKMRKKAALSCTFFTNTSGPVKN